MNIDPLSALTDEQLVTMMNECPDELSGAAQDELERRGWDFGGDPQDKEDA